MLKALESILFGGRAECQFDTLREAHVLLLPGMLAPVRWLFPLVRYLRVGQSRYGITAVPLGQSTAEFEKVVQIAAINIETNLLSKVEVKEIILFGHSHGGRVACSLFWEILHKYPQMTIRVITAGTPVAERPNRLPWYKRYSYYLFSTAFRCWPLIQQPEVQPSITGEYIGYYSENDEVVTSQIAKTGHQGTLIELKDFSHADFIDPNKMGPVLLAFLEKH